jgi:phosphoglucosamine mutase
LDEQKQNVQHKIEFGTDGIRGVAGEYPLDPATVLKIGRAIGLWLRQNASEGPRVLIGRDTRISGNMILHTLAGGLLSEGIDVVSTGVISTPGIAYLTRQGKFSMGIVISASHNPFEQNGIKLFGADGFKLIDSAEDAIEQLIAGLGDHEPATQLGRFTEATEQPQYVAHLASGYDFDTLEDIGIVLDCANGAASAIAADAFRHAGALRLTKLNAEPDGLNINVKAGSEHVRRDRTALLDAIVENQADIGIAFDGDADRVVFVTPDGTLVDGDHIMGILALALRDQKKLPGQTVVATDMSNSGLEHFLNEQGIQLSRTKVGDRYVMDRMRQNGFALGGEQAGHIILLDDQHTSGDGIHVGLLVAAMIARNKRNGGPTINELATRIPRYPQVIASAHLHQRTDLAQVAGLAELQEETLAAFEHKGRVNIRFSGTEPNLLRAMVEGGPQTTMDQVIERAVALCMLVAQAVNTPQPVIDVVDCVTGAPIKLNAI